jgi:CRP/FNR family transcriptional regulator, cyclic AMP receptor protein
LTGGWHVVDFVAIPFKRRLAAKTGLAQPSHWRLDAPNTAGTVGRNSNGNYPGSGADQLDPPEKFLMNDNAIPPFDPQAFLANANGGRTISTYKINQIVFSQGGPADSIFYIQEGKVKLTVLSEQAKEAIVAILGTGDFCGEGCLAGQPRRMATAAAMEESAIMRLEKAAMIRLLHDEPEFSERFMSHLLARNIRVEADLIDQLFNSSEKRLARLLLILAKFGKEGKPEPVIAKISQETLAEMIGTTRSRVSFFMNRFRKMGLIDYNGHLEIHSSLLNVVLHDEPHISR